MVLGGKLFNAKALQNYNQLVNITINKSKL